MFFIFGTPRSGTTLVSSTLDQHEDIVIPDETDFIVPLCFLISRIKDPAVGRELIAKMVVSTERYRSSIGRYLSPGDVEAVVEHAPYTAPAILDALYSRMASAAGKKYAGDKSPNDLGYFGILVTTNVLGPGRKIIHVVRDVRDVIVSLLKTGWSTQPERIAQTWMNSNTLLARICGSERDRYLRIRYEDLVQRPGDEVRRMCDFLGVPYQERMLDDTKRAHRYQGVAHHVELSKPISDRNIGKWMAEMDEALRKQCEKIAEPGMDLFGYR